MNDSYSTKAVEDEAVCVDEKSEKAIPKTSPGSRLVQFALGMIGFGRYSVPTEKRRELDLFLTSRRRLKFGILFALFALYVLWGGTYLAMRIALQSFPPFLLSGIRFLIAGSILYVFLRARGGESPTRKQWIGAALVGILLLAGGNGGVVFAEQWVASGLASLGIAAVPLWAALFSGLFGRWPNRKEWLGLGIGFIGVMLLNLENGFSANPLGAIALLIAPMSWAFGSIWSSRLPLPKGLMASAAQMLAGGLVLVILGLSLGERVTRVPAAGPIWAMLFLIFGGSLVAYSAYGYLLTHVRPVLATSYAYVNPAVAVGLGALFAGEKLTPVGFVAMLAILTGVCLLSLVRQH
ncbi:MAG TPA: drug/metabolite exporter YedA [Ktedonobacteraceae bacterium]|jgi:drug/metabolite transporter (DMT)-like permease|nr:drug/metabolite exporter YedA [Ktedonobacteraceae bacterium]